MRGDTEKLTHHLMAQLTAKACGNIGNAFLHAEEVHKLRW